MWCGNILKPPFTQLELKILSACAAWSQTSVVLTSLSMIVPKEGELGVTASIKLE